MASTSTSCANWITVNTERYQKVYRIYKKTQSTKQFSFNNKCIYWFLVEHLLWDQWRLSSPLFYSATPEQLVCFVNGVVEAWYQVPAQSESCMCRSVQTESRHSCDLQFSLIAFGVSFQLLLSYCIVLYPEIEQNTCCKTKYCCCHFEICSSFRIAGQMRTLETFDI